MTNEELIEKLARLNVGSFDNKLNETTRVRIILTNKFCLDMMSKPELISLIQIDKDTVMALLKAFPYYFTEGSEKISGLDIAPAQPAQILKNYIKQKTDWIIVPMVQQKAGKKEKYWKII